MGKVAAVRSDSLDTGMALLPLDYLPFVSQTKDSLRRQPAPLPLTKFHLMLIKQLL